MILGIDYSIRSDLQNDTLPVEVLIPRYKGVILAFKTVQIVEQKERAIVRFSYDILNPGPSTEELLRKDEVFENTLGLILNAMVLSIVDTGQEIKDSETVIE